jgi:hypothetical protein
MTDYFETPENLLPKSWFLRNMLRELLKQTTMTNNNNNNNNNKKKKTISTASQSYWCL